MNDKTSKYFLEKIIWYKKIQKIKFKKIKKTQREEKIQHTRNKAKKSRNIV